MSVRATSIRWPTSTPSLVLVAALFSWLGVLVIARDMGAMPGTMGLGFGAFVAVWALMMAAMMLPSVLPFASLHAGGPRAGRRVRLVGLSSGYLLVWVAAAFPAYGLAWLVDRLVVGHATGSTVVASVIFVACGVYQLTPIKDRCLAQCRSPLGFKLKYAGYRGKTRDLRAGVDHGAFCVGCCWALMMLLLAFGLMNVWAMAVLTAVVLIEKSSPWGMGFGRVVGLIALGLAVLVVFVPDLAPGLHPVAHSGMGSMN